MHGERHRRSLTLVALATLVVTTFGVRLMIGPSETPWQDVMSVLMRSARESGSADLLWEFRLPQAVTAALAGAALALSGLQMQTIFDNPLAGPWALGLIAGAQLAVALLIVSGVVFGVPLSGALSPVSLSGITIAAAVGAVGALGVALRVARHVSPATLLICGLLFSAVLDGVRGFLIHLADIRYELLFLSWNDAGFGGVTWVELRVFAAAVTVGLLLAFMLSKRLDGLLLGATYARSLGIDVTVTRRVAMLSTVCLAGAATAFSGAVLFIDLAVAHLCRRVFRTSEHRFVVPATAMTGACLALVADAAVSLLPGSERLPVNVVTCLLGGPVVVGVLLRGELRSVHSR
jgi:iron complex transport system permease protein